ncbi:MAG: hypothetical protein M1821_001251 [Bathelium mastoideum]|nr:MAG: hypothetical protein M1821_001251 [Bathelium mastoideum]
MAVQLPVDILHLICSELANQKDFDTLYNCAQTNRQFAIPAFANLYSIAHHSKFSDATSQAFVPHQELLVQKWAILWRSIILSSFDKTFFTYCRYLRALDLYDLGQLLDVDKFRGKIEKKFFEGELAAIHFTETPRTKSGRPAYKQLNINAITNQVGDAVTDKAPLLEALFSNSGLVSSTALKKWIPKLNKLQELKLFTGEALADEEITQLVNTNCLSFCRLGIFVWLSPTSDHELATFLHGIRPPSFYSLELFSVTGIGADSFRALNRHAATLKLLRLSVRPEACPSLSLLQDCTAIETLILDSSGASDLERTHPAEFAACVTWLQACRQLRVLEFNKFPSAAALATAVLEGPPDGGGDTADPTLTPAPVPPLQTLQVEGYAMRERRAFHAALARQPGLRTLVLRGDAEGCGPDDVEILCAAVGAIRGLRDLKLRGVSELFKNEHVSELAMQLPALEHLYVEGYGINDGVWPALGTLRQLQWISFYGLTTFTRDGLMRFVATLERPGNEGIVVMVDNADIEDRLTEEEQAEVREAIIEKVDGRFEYTLYRDPDISEYEGESD